MRRGDAERPTAAVEWTGLKRRHRIRFEKRPAGGWTRVKQSAPMDGEGWRTEGTEPVADVQLSAAVAGDD
jgi:hypothetical protein